MFGPATYSRWCASAKRCVPQLGEDGIRRRCWAGAVVAPLRQTVGMRARRLFVNWTIVIRKVCWMETKQQVRSLPAVSSTAAAFRRTCGTAIPRLPLPADQLTLFINHDIPIGYASYAWATAGVGYNPVAGLFWLRRLPAHCQHVD